MEVNSDEVSGVKSETTSDDEITILEDEADIDANDKDSSCSKARVVEYTVEDSVMEAETSPGDPSQDKIMQMISSEGGTTSYAMAHDQGADKSWVWNRDSEVQPGSKEMQTNRRGSTTAQRFQCGICGTNFTLLKNAKRHYRCQHLNYFYWCKYCVNGKKTRRYTRREFLEDHFMSHHPDIQCEISETNKAIPSSQYDILHVYVEDEEVDDGSSEMVTTSDLCTLDRNVLFEDSSRDTLDNQVCLDQGDHAGTRNDSSSRGQFIDLADYRGFANESSASTAPPKHSAQGSLLPSLPDAQSKKVLEIENRAYFHEPSALYSDDTPVEKGESSRNAKTSHSSSSHVSQFVMNPSSSRCDQSVASTSSKNTRQDGAINSGSAFHPSSAITQDYLIIGNAIPLPGREGIATERISSVTTSSSIAAQSHNSPNLASQSVARSSARHAQIQTSSVPESTSHETRKQTDSFGRASHMGRLRGGDCSGVNSSSDARSKKRMMGQLGLQQSYEEVLSGEDAPASERMSCREILSKYHKRIRKYSKEIDYKYSSDGRRVRGKTVRHVFLFNKSEDESEEQCAADTKNSNKSASCL